jgi:hypothetical protein
VIKDAKMLNQQWILEVYVAAHCTPCDYALEVAAYIQRDYPHVNVRIIDIEQVETLPESVFATPIYLLNGRVWSLGNPSAEKIRQSFAQSLWLAPLPRPKSDENKVERKATTTSVFKHGAIIRIDATRNNS